MRDIVYTFEMAYAMSLAFQPAELFSGTKNDLYVYLLCALPYQVIQLFGTL